jgi:hypothetical protein
MFTISKRIPRAGLGLLALGTAAILLAGCATPAPVVGGNTAYGLAGIEADGPASASELVAALEMSGLPASGAPSAAYADVTIDSVRYNSAFLGLFYGGPDHAAMSVRLKDADGRTLDTFDVFVGVNATGTAADAELAAKAASIIAAKAAHAFPPMGARPKAVAPEPAVVLPADPEPVLDQPVPAPKPMDDGGDPLCIIGADGQCIPV